MASANRGIPDMVALSQSSSSISPLDSAPPSEFIIQEADVKRETEEKNVSGVSKPMRRFFSHASIHLVVFALLNYSLLKQQYNKLPRIQLPSLQPLVDLKLPTLIPASSTTSISQPKTAPIGAWPKGCQRMNAYQRWLDDDCREYADSIHKCNLSTSGNLVNSNCRLHQKLVARQKQHSKEENVQKKTNKASKNASADRVVFSERYSFDVGMDTTSFFVLGGYVLCTAKVVQLMFQLGIEY